MRYNLTMSYYFEKDFTIIIHYTFDHENIKALKNKKCIEPDLLQLELKKFEGKKKLAWTGI